MFRRVIALPGLSKPSKKFARIRHQAMLDLLFDMGKGSSFVLSKRWIFAGLLYEILILRLARNAESP
jgi:hypothetical protein